MHSKKKVSQIASIRVQNFTGRISGVGMASRHCMELTQEEPHDHQTNSSPRQPRKKLAKASFFVARLLRRSLQGD